MLRKAPALKYSLIIGVPMLLLGFLGGWLSAIVLGGRIPIGGDLAAFAGPGMGANAASPQELRDKFGVFWEVWNLVEGEFYARQSLDREKMIHGAIKGMLGALDDQYTVYQEPDLAAQTSEYMQGTFEGIGAYIRITDGKAYVDRPFKNSPALKAGLRQDDEIISVDGALVTPLIAQLDVNAASVKVVSLIRGPKGTSVTLQIRRGVQPPFEAKIARDSVIVSSVNSQMLADGVAYVQITDFKSTTTSDFDAALRELLPSHPKGIVLDLRNNPGGYLTNAQEVLGRFYSGTALYEEDRAGAFTSLNTISGPSDARAFDTPLVVLINSNSASASEIVAGALHDERKATYLIGEKSYGKGSVQNIHALSDGGSARITIAHWLTPDKTEIHKIGITPQYIVPYNEDATNGVPCVLDRRPAAGQAACADSQLAAALTLLTTGTAPPQMPAAAK